MIPLPAVPFWAYGTGAALALAAGRQLQWWQRSVADGGVRTRSPAASPYLTLTLLYFAVLAAPAGAYLLWQDPAWTTMQAADGHRGVWAGFALLAAGAPVVAGLLGFLAARWLVLVGAGYGAYLQAVGGHFLLFFALVHGWDGSGPRRLLSADGRAYREWAGGRPVNHVLGFLTSGTFLAVLVFGTVLAGTVLVMQIGWLAEGWRLPGADRDRRVGRVTAVAVAGSGVYGLPGAGAVAATALVRWTGWLPGAALFAVLAGAVLLPARGPVRRLYRLVGVPARHWRAEEAAGAAARA
ncbi:hypothetical protein [Streptomyces sp. NPDC089919]|uniref:hypothetical protein n=1 Tax=Streptomyces sp. NPDC089919 TaxID=3155188 RepID=UPI003436FB7B